MSQSDELANFNPRATYDTAAVDYEKASSVYWSFFGQRTAARLALQPGAAVLDVACGTGSSALTAAELVGPSGRIIAVDYAEQMLTLARAKAQERGLRNVEFRLADMTNLGFPEGHFDAVVCALGIFFVENMAKQVSELWRMVRAGGQLALATVGPHFFTPLYGVWKAAVLAERPDMYIAPPWERTNDPAVVRQLMTDGGVPHAEVTVEHNSLTLTAPEEWWHIVMGTGLRRYVDEMGAEVAARVREHNLAWAQANGVTSLTLSAIYAVATKVLVQE